MSAAERPEGLTPAPTHSERNIALEHDRTVISCGKCGKVLLVIACRACFPEPGEATLHVETDSAHHFALKAVHRLFGTDGAPMPWPDPPPKSIALGSDGKP